MSSDFYSQLSCGFLLAMWTLSRLLHLTKQSKRKETPITFYSLTSHPLLTLP